MKSYTFLIITTALCFLTITELANAQVYKGVVLDEATRKPVPYVTVSLQNAENEFIRYTSTDEEGNFLLEAPDVKDYYLYAKRIGYSGNTGGPFLVEAGDTLSVEFRIFETTETLSEITVEGTPYEQTLIDNYLKAHSFYTRKQQGLGQFFTREDIQERHLNNTSDLFRYTHGVRKKDGMIVNQRGNCSPQVIRNGMTMTSVPPRPSQGMTTGSISLDLYASPDDIVGLEIYSGLAGQPSQFGYRSRCGAIVIWTL